jgi:hypothetical protein
MAVLIRAPALASDVPEMSCSEIGSFARQVAEDKAAGVMLENAIRRLRQSWANPDTEHELEKIVRAIYGIPIFSTATPDQIDVAYQSACEME